MTTEQKTSSARRSATTANEKIAAKPAAEQNTSFARRSNTNVNDRLAAKPVKENNTFASRKSTTEASSKQTVNRNSVQTASKSRPTGKPATGGESFSNRRSNEHSQAVKSPESSEKKKSAETAKNTHRR
jgi:hypothetical protein